MGDPEMCLAVIAATVTGETLRSAGPRQRSAIIATKSANRLRGSSKARDGRRYAGIHVEAGGGALVLNGVRAERGDRRGRSFQLTLEPDEDQGERLRRQRA